MDDSIYSYSESSLKLKYKGKVCCVPNCNNKEGLDIVRFFKIIRQDKAQTEKWIQAIKRKNTDGTLWMPTKNNKICSEHFQSTQEVLCKIFCLEHFGISYSERDKYRFINMS